MRYRSLLFSVAVLIAASLFLFRLFEREISRLWLNVAVHPEFQQVLVDSASDQRTLARLRPEQESVYRERFENLQRLRNNLLILEHNREALSARFEMALWGLFVLIVGTGLVIHWISGRRVAARVLALQRPLEDLVAGRTDVVVPDKRRDSIGRIGGMIEQTSHVMARQQGQLRYLRHLSAWQEASRRHAHEIRTPLTAARLEVERLLSIEAEAPLRERIQSSGQSVLEELDRLAEFTRAFTAFAKVRRPTRERVDIDAYLRDFQELFQNAWPNLKLVYRAASVDASPGIDREMVRQVLLNLCNNSALALGEHSGVVTMTLSQSPELIILDVADDGPGIDPKVVDRLFAPYTTTRGVGEGMGLGLAISRKIMLDHGGDLELAATSTEGAVFRLSFPLTENEAPAITEPPADS